VLCTGSSVPLRGIIRTYHPPKVDDVPINESEVNSVSNENAGYIVERGEYKGKPILVIKRDENDKYPFSFGVSKAKLILGNLEEIKKFVEENSG